MKHLTKITDYRVDIEKLKSVYFNTIEKIIEWSKDDPNLYDFNAICVNQVPKDPLSIRGGNIRGLYWTYPKENWEEEEKIIDNKIPKRDKISKRFSKKHITGINLHDVLSIRNWLVYAKKINDESYKKIYSDNLNSSYIDQSLSNQLKIRKDNFSSKN